MLQYSSIVVLRPSRDWELEVLFFKIDDKYEFPRQWLDTNDDPISMILQKLFRITELRPEIISLKPILINKGDEYVEYYCAIITPHQKINKITYYNDVVWQRSKKLFTMLRRDEEREALIAGLRWTKSDDFAALVMSRNRLFIK